MRISLLIFSFLSLYLMSAQTWADEKIIFKEDPTSKCKFDGNIKSDFPRAVRLTDNFFPIEMLPSNLTVVESCELDSIDDETVGLSATANISPLSMNIYIHEYAHSILGKFLGPMIYKLRDQYSDAANEYWRVSKSKLPGNVDKNISPEAKKLWQKKESLERQVLYSSGLDEFFADMVALTILEQTVFETPDSLYTRDYGNGPSQFDIRLQTSLRKNGIFDFHYFLMPIWKRSMAMASNTFGSNEKKMRFLAALMSIIKDDIDHHLEYYGDHDDLDPDKISERLWNKIKVIEI